MVNSASNNEVSLNIREYDKAGLSQIRLEFAPQNSNAWNTIKAFSPAELSDGNNGTFFTWQVANLPDGAYKLRAKVDCDGGATYSEKKVGIIDRNAPTVFGIPEPADGVFEEGDVVSVTFDEPVNCLNIARGLISMKRLSDGRGIAVDIGCSGID